VSKHFNITKEQFKTIKSSKQWEHFLRQFEIEKILDNFPENLFDRALELGCGSGRYSKYLAGYCKKLTALEYNKELLIEKNSDKITFVAGDAQDLSRFGNEEMDLIFSANLIEHLPRLQNCLAECHRAIKPDGLIIHTVPNRMWKIFNLILYYPFGIKTLFKRIFSSGKNTWTGGSKITKSKLDSSLRPLSEKPSIWKLLLLKTHGISKSHLREFKNWGQQHWINAFKKSDLKVVDIVKLPFYFGWGYNFRFILKLGNYLGLSSSTAFILKKAKKK
jgi:ubiquinone/menaquinone biosynthesis C-methylase UbiE